MDLSLDRSETGHRADETEDTYLEEYRGYGAISKMRGHSHGKEDGRIPLGQERGKALAVRKFSEGEWR